MNYELLSPTSKILLPSTKTFLVPYTAAMAQEVFIKNDEQSSMQLFGLQTAEDAQRFKTTIFSSNDYRTCMLFTICHEEKVIGSCNFHIWIPKHFRAEIGYMLDEQYRNKGIMKEAVKNVLNYGFEKMGLNRVEAFVGHENIPSLKLVTHFGFQKEGVMREHYFKNDRLEDSVCFSLLRREYELQKTSG
ncbi:MAG TPA: GNAT family protein [Flavipsychrobacter sp.]|nr:GNAT family protein [Flavipsychrobacter sp.]